MASVEAVLEKLMWPTVMHLDIRSCWFRRWEYPVQRAGLGPVDVSWSYIVMRSSGSLENGVDGWRMGIGDDSVGVRMM